MPPAFAAIPKNAPFSEEDLDLFNRVMGPASPIQRAWLAGFLAGVESVSGGEAIHPAVPPRAAEPLTIVFASESAIRRSSPATWPSRPASCNWPT
jgi:sulfite reductase (NADPH) flavoprotein alpha-component